ncbi:putative protease [Desulforapulum autotrophicum HRM2]|uniref:Protease n=1 Tax=Desulforapulum autotrophicum (strain ATCC 43914 / DSM 3382 / VKM B-1955 / HRM2) TaxID=177437 RepID=C0QHX9_DESAH|nr:M6 family metalloprotease domain-containing protein [Desulforapulum autotrophicum]ACN13687.1 putative protease [Desulforapulum autotrophicum HRM2]
MPIPYTGEEFTFYNPDGSEVRVRGWGDQFFAVFETLEGYTVVKDPKSGFYHYAELSPDKSTLLPGRIRVGDVPPEQLSLPQHLQIDRQAAKKQARAAEEEAGVRPRWMQRRDEHQQKKARMAPSPDDEDPSPATVGNYVGLCLLIQFPDVPGTIDSGKIDNFCNQTEYSEFGNNGSVRDYFYDISDGKLTYMNRVTAYYTANHNRSHYTNPAISFGMRARELIIEALNDLKNKGFNFSQLTADGSGYVRALNIFYAGARVNNWSEGLWPHSWALASPYTASSNRKFSDYQITNIGSQLTLRTFCHENGHMICDFPDLYDYGGQSSGVGNFCLMCSGGSNVNPTQVCAYLKYDAGWASKLTNLGPGMSVNVSSGKNDFLILKKSNQTEYFIIENRRQNKRDTALPDEGLAIWHVDELGSNDNEQMTLAKHYKCSLEQADGRLDLERRANNGDSTDLFGAPDYRKFGFSTTPNSKWWDGSASGLEITNISAPGVTITVKTQALWQNNREVLRTHAKNSTKSAWAYFKGDSAWNQVSASTTDGCTNLFFTLCEGLANNRKVDVLIKDGKIIQATLK